MNKASRWSSEAVVTSFILRLVYVTMLHAAMQLSLSVNANACACGTNPPSIPNSGSHAMRPLIVAVSIPMTPNRHV